MRTKQWSEWLWDAWCIVSIIGIWPRFIEPRLIKIKRIRIPHTLNIKLLHFSDLHWSAQFSPNYQKKIIAKIHSLKPDLILFTGDFLSRSKLENPEGLLSFLNALKAPFGCFAVLGNHDYAEFVTLNAQGDYDIEKPSTHSTILKGFKRLFNGNKLTKQFTEKVRQVKSHPSLIELLNNTPFQLLNNSSKLIEINGHFLNICGLEDYSAGKCLPSEAFKNYDHKYPGIILSHNPDTFPLLATYPGDLILSGHTHGGQINLPWIWKRFTRLENQEYKSGLKKLGKKWGYINRGISGIMKFRWFASPELTFITLGTK